MAERAIVCSAALLVAHCFRACCSALLFCRSPAPQDQKFILRELLTGLGIGLGCGVAWKSWQWSDKARRIENNNKWDRYYPVWANQIKVRRETQARHTNNTEGRLHGTHMD